MNIIQRLETNMEGHYEKDHSNKSILARGCDPTLSLYASKHFPPHLGNPEYIPTTTDDDFIEKFRSRKWSVVYFAPGACRYSAAKMSIPGGIADTRGWSLEDYKELVYKYQGEEVQIVESVNEEDAFKLHRKALEKSE